MQVEFQRGWRLSEKVLESISFRVPRVKKDLFQRDLFPNALVTWEAVNSIKDWKNGHLNPVKYIDLCPPNTEESRITISIFLIILALNVARMVTQKIATRPKIDTLTKKIELISTTPNTILENTIEPMELKKEVLVTNYVEKNTQDIQKRLENGLSEIIKKDEDSVLLQDKMDGVSDSEWLDEN